MKSKQLMAQLEASNDAYREELGKLLLLMDKMKNIIEQQSQTIAAQQNMLTDLQVMLWMDFASIDLPSS